MGFNFNIQRDLVTQTFRTFPRALIANAAAVALDAGGSKQQLITSFSISNPVASGGSVYIGNQAVTDPAGVNPGFEIQAGTAPAFKILQEGRQLYELQGLTAQIATILQCTNVTLEKIPFVVFDMSQIFAFATVNITVTIITFPTMYL